MLLFLDVNSKSVNCLYTNIENVILNYRTYYTYLDLEMNSGNVFDYREGSLDSENQPAKNNLQLI